MTDLDLLTVHTLLVVEDEPDVRLLIKAHLRRDPRINVAGEAVSADQALSLIRKQTPDLIILDHSIKGDVMGLAAAPKLKELAPDCRIILFTAFNMAQAAGAEPAIDLFLSKADMQKLLPNIQTLLGLDPLPG